MREPQVRAQVREPQVRAQVREPQVRAQVRELFSTFFKITNMSCPQLNSKNNDLRLLFKTIFSRLFSFLSFVATDVKDGNRLN